MKRLIFPCGCYFPLNEWPVDGAHYAKDGAIRILVHPGTKPDITPECTERLNKKYKFSADFPYDGPAAPCQFYCPTPKRRREERGYDSDGRLRTFVSCYARLCSQEHLAEEDSGWYDVTPIPPEKCPHCEEQKTYERECRRAARNKESPPDRQKWRKCSVCGEHREMYESTGRCSMCQLCEVMRTQG